MSKKRYWFKAKKYGWGWYPGTWEGYLIILVYILYVTWRALEMGAMFDTASSAVFRYVFELLPPTVILIVICYLKGEKPGWRWGDK